MDTQTTKTAAEIRATIRRLGPRGKGRRYPEELKRDALGYVAERRKVGRGLRTASAELGIPERSLHMWSSAPRSSSTPSFIAMTLADVPEPRPAGGIVVHAPGGVRVEGLDVASLADLLRRLA